MQIKKHLLSTMLVAMAGLSRSVFAADTQYVDQILYPAGTQQSFKGPEKYFTGDVQVNMLFPDNDTAHYSGAYVTFAPGARTAWHMHPAGQHMIVTKGTALTGTRDGKILTFKEGETVWCPSEIDHWHGATPDASMTHLVITGSKDGKNVIWKEKVTDAQYFGNERKGNKSMGSIKKGHQQKEKTTVDTHALTEKQQAIIPIASFTAGGDIEQLKTAIDTGLKAGLSVNEIKEIQIHLYAYAGFPRALNGLATLMTVLNERKAKGIIDPMGKDASPLPSDQSSLELGKKVQTQLSGKPVTGPLFDFAPAINQFLQSHLFGDLFSRDILNYQSREIATVSALASIDGLDAQLKAHIRIASNVGLTKKQLTALAAVLDETVGKKEEMRVGRAIQAVLPDQGESS